MPGTRGLLPLRISSQQAENDARDLIRYASWLRDGAADAPLREQLAALEASRKEEADFVGGVREIKLFGTHDHEDRRFAAVSETLRQQTMRTVRVSAVNVPLVQVLAVAEDGSSADDAPVQARTARSNCSWSAERLMSSR